MKKPAELVLPLIVIAVVGIMVVPMPRLVLDCLLTLNIAFSLLLFVFCFFLDSPRKLTVLPAVLLLVTVLRLSLNIATTRQILSGSDVPEIVRTFGELAVGGSIAVGMVVFLIVTIIQFIVVSKGAERVAEVTARFTLDAMPGKQMAIDADVRSGFLGIAEARFRRHELERESRLYGALDGAMKFIRGDAVAGIIITSINLVFGVLIGVASHSLSLAESVQQFSLLTIGDGLCSQLPSLLVSLSAGLAVTRVESQDGGVIGGDILSQITSEPRSLFITAFSMLLVAFVPGAPSTIFVIAAGLIFFWGGRKLSASRQKSVSTRFTPQQSFPICLRGSASVLESLRRDVDMPVLYLGVRERFFNNYGLLLPELGYLVAVEAAQGNVVEISVNGFIKKCSWQGPESGQAVRLIEILEEAVCRNAVRLVDDTQTRLLLDYYSGQHEDLVNAAVPGVLNVTGLTQILRSLIREGVPINEFARILQAVADYQLNRSHGLVINASGNSVPHGLRRNLQLLRSADGERLSFSELIADVREAIGPAVCRGLINEEGRLAVLRYSAEAEEVLLSHALEESTLPSEFVASLIESVKENIQEGASIVLAPRYARLLLYNLLVDECPGVRVVAPAEVRGVADIHVIETISPSSVVNDPENYLVAHAA